MKWLWDAIQGPDLTRVGKLFVIIGLLVTVKRLLEGLRGVYRSCLRRPHNLLERYGPNSWVLVTGSSEGIGKALAVCFARRGFNVVVSGRVESKLEAVERELTALSPGIQTRRWVIDFSRAGEAGFLEGRLGELASLDLAVLVNNVGVDVLRPLVDQAPEAIAKLIVINCTAASLLTRLVLPRLKERGRHRSGVVNVGSVAGELPLAFHNVYSASKAFVNFFSDAVRQENPDVDVLCLRPSEVSTAMTNNRPPDLLTVTAEQCAEAAVRCLGRSHDTHGHWSHAAQSWLYASIPRWLFNLGWCHVVAPQYMRERKLHGR